MDFKSFQSEKSVNQTVDLAKQISSAFQGKSEGEIYSTILSQAEQGKRDGTLTNDDLENFYRTLSPLLDHAKRQQLKFVIQKLKSI